MVAKGMVKLPAWNMTRVPLGSVEALGAVINATTLTMTRIEKNFFWRKFFAYRRHIVKERTTGNHRHRGVG
jgi:hypothetical protein